MGGAEWVGAIGLGAILTKVLDAVWVSRILEKQEARRWLQDRRLDAFTTLAKDLLSFGLHNEGADDPFQALANASTDS